MSIINCQLQLSIVNYPDSSGISVRNSRGSNSEPETPLKMRHTTINGEGAGIDSLALARVCHPPFVKGVAHAACAGGFRVQRVPDASPYLHAPYQRGLWTLASQAHSAKYPTAIPQSSFNCQFPISHFQLSIAAVHCQLSIINCQLSPSLSTFHYQLSIINYQLNNS